MSHVLNYKDETFVVLDKIHREHRDVYDYVVAKTQGPNTGDISIVTHEMIQEWTKIAKAKTKFRSDLADLIKSENTNDNK